jgi:uncharacterized phage protein (TIGR02220 family)
MSIKREFTGVFIPAHIWSSKELIPAEKMILGEIDALSKSRGYCDASRQHFADWLSCSVQNVSFYFTKLERLGFIFIEKIPGYRSKIRLNNERFYEAEGVNGTEGGGKPHLRVGVNGTEGGGKRGLPEIQDKIQDKIKDKDTCSFDSENQDIPLPKNKKKENEKTAAVEIVAHLNQKSKSEFRPERKSTNDAINARLKEGFTKDDFLNVIDVKCLEWIGTEQEKYLRPETLFCAKHFESYLMQAKKWIEQGRPQTLKKNVTLSAKKPINAFGASADAYSEKQAF